MHKPTIVRRWTALLSAAILAMSSMQTGVLAADQADPEDYVLETVLEQEETPEEAAKETAGDETPEETVEEAEDQTTEETLEEAGDQMAEETAGEAAEETAEETAGEAGDQIPEGIDEAVMDETANEAEEEAADDLAAEAEEAVASEDLPDAQETAENETDPALGEQAAAASNFVMMNIPYDVFYRQIVGTAGDEGIDGFSSATGRKQAYFWDSSYKGNAVVAYGEGTTLKGVYFPVKFSAEDYAQLDLSAEYQPSMSYSFRAANFSAVPDLYTVGSISEDDIISFSHYKGTSKILSGAEVSISDSTKHGDYMLTVTGDGGVLSEAARDTMTVFGAVLKTAEGGTYNMRHLENLYYKDFNQIAFCTTSAATGKGLTVEPIAELEGQTIEEIDFLTNSGIFVVYTSTHVAHSQYVLMNIPYDKFYEAEIGAADAVDAVTSATHNKPRTGGLAGGSYHVNADGSDISGVIYPVYVKDPAVLAGYTQVTAESSVEITVTNRGQTSTTTYTGKDALFESADYSYYVLDEAPNYYKVMNADGTFSEIMSGNAPAQAEIIEGATGNATIGARHADVEISLSLPSGITTGQAVSGVIVTTDDGEKTALRHVANIWRATEIGWNLTENEIGGKTITNIRYITQNALIDYPVSIEVGKSAYVLMNIPYDKFYEAEIGAADAVDAVTSATHNKPRTGGLAGGSYHVNADGSDISGVIYPVFISDYSMLADFTQVTDESSVEITVTNRGQTSTTTYTGKDALFESADYSYYVLDEKPAIYKKLNADGTFSAISMNRVPSVAGVTGAVTVGARHADIEIKLSGTEGIAQGDAVSGIVLTTDDGNKYALRHVANIWRATEIGWSLDENDIVGKTITNIRYYTQTKVIDYPTEIAVSEPAYVLMNIPYDKFYEAEMTTGAPVDAVTSATHNKPRTGTLAGGSYHVNADGSDITGVIYPVLVEDASMLLDYKQIMDSDSVTITVRNRGRETTTTYRGRDALFESGSYSYYVLDEKPAVYKKMQTDGTFTAVNARAASVAGVTGAVTLNARHADVEIALAGTEGIAQGDAVSGIIVTTDDGTQTGLRHIANIWRATEIGWNYGDNDIAGRTITNIRYITRSGVIDYPVEICVHSLEKVEAKEADYDSAGNIEYYRCSVCGRLFKDANGLEETTKEEVKIPQLIHDLGKVTNLKSACHLNSMSITLTYDTVEYAQSYQLVYREKGASAWKRIRIGTANPYELTGLKPGASYDIKIRAAQKIDGTWHYGAYSKIVRRTMVTSTLTAKTSKRLIKLTIGEVDGADQYQIIFADNADMTNAKKMTTGKLKVTIRNLEAGKKYYFRVRPLFKEGTKTYRGVRSKRYKFKTQKK